MNHHPTPRRPLTTGITTALGALLIIGGTLAIAPAANAAPGIALAANAAPARIAPAANAAPTRPDHGSLPSTTGPQTPPAQPAACPDNGWSILDGRTGRFFAGNGINIRTGPSTHCTSLGLGSSTHQVQLDCWKPGEGGSWSHLLDSTTHVQGWVKDTLLVGEGAHIRC
jgi:hypothetical protein